MLFKRLNAKMIRMSRSNQYPPQYWEDTSEFRNCYAHALDIGIEDFAQMIFIPGMISAIENENSAGVITKPFVECYEREDLIAPVIEDCEALGLKARETSLQEEGRPNSYKVILCEEQVIGCWHFVRESVAENGNRIWTQKMSWNMPSSVVKVEGNKVYTQYGTYNILAVLEISPM